MKTNRWILVGSLVAVLLLSLVVGLTWAQGPGQEGGASAQGDVSIAATVSSKISYQGLLQENGQPVTGSRDMTFRLYSDNACSTQVGSDIVKSGVQVTNGLFSVDLDVDQSNFNGQGLWLEVEVGGTKIGCQEILPVPYALSLRPGSTISGTLPFLGPPLLTVQSGGTSGSLASLQVTSIWPPQAHSVGVAGRGDWGIYGYSQDSNGYGGYFENANGTALKAAGSGIIQSTAVSRIFIPAIEAVPHSSSRNDLELNYYGRGLVEVRKVSAGAGTEKILIPIAIPAVLYGQQVRIRDIRVHYGVSSATSYIDATYLYRQSTTPASPTWWPGYSTVIANTTNRSSTNFTYYHLDCTASECRLGDDASILTLELDLHFADTTHKFAIGGVRVTLEHD